MPRFNKKADLCIGLGRDWFDQERTIAQECNTVQSGCVVALSDRTIVYPAGATSVNGCGCSVWAITPYPQGGYLDSYGRSFPESAPGPVGPNGEIAIKRLYNSYGPWDVLESGNVYWRLTDGDAYDIQLLGSGLAIWRESNTGFQLHMRGFSFAQPQGEWGGPRVVDFNGRWALLYQSYTGGCLVFDDKVVADGVAFYRPDAIVVDNMLHITWSHEPQEVGVTPPPLVMHISALNSLETIQHRLEQVQPIPPDPEPPKPDPIPPKPEPKPKYPTATKVNKMESQEVALILIDGKYISFSSTGNLKLDNATISEDCKFTLTKPDSLWSIVHKKTNKWLGADATQHSPNVASQLYLVDHRQGYESWNLEHPAPPDNDLISAFVVFRRPEGINFSVKLRVVEL